MRVLVDLPLTAGVLEDARDRKVASAGPAVKPTVSRVGFTARENDFFDKAFVRREDHDGEYA